MKSFADDVQRRGGSLSSRVEGDITVQHLTQIEEFRQRQKSTHLWRPHADALLLLEESATQAIQYASSVLDVANQRGLVDKAKALSASIDRLRNRVEQAREALAQAGVQPLTHQ